MLFLHICSQVLKLMIEAWRRRLMFTVGISYTTGSSDVVTWNEIHHKTELHGNYFGHGYPDPSYLANVILELADHGVTEDCLWVEKLRRKEDLCDGKSMDSIYRHWKEKWVFFINCFFGFFLVFFWGGGGSFGPNCEKVILSFTKDFSSICKLSAIKQRTSPLR